MVTLLNYKTFIMKTHQYKYKVALFSSYLLGLCLSSNALANQKETPSDGFIIVGALSQNEYIGSSDYGIVPAVISQFNLLGSDIEIEGLTARAEI